MFYDRFAFLCFQRGISPSRAAVEAGISKSLVTKWKTNNVKYPSADIAQKLAAYCGLTVAELLNEETEKAPTPEGERVISDEELKFALWGDVTDIDEVDLEDVKRFAAFVRERKKKK